MREKHNDFGTNPALGGAAEGNPSGQSSERSRRLREPSPAAAFFSDPRRPKTRKQIFRGNWKRERQRRLARICRAVDCGLARGKRLLPMLKRHAWRWRGRGRHYSADPSRPIRFSFGTLVRIYYGWKRSGAGALALRYASGSSRISSGQLREFAEICLRPGTTAFATAYRALPNPGFSEAYYRGVWERRLRGLVKPVFEARREAEKLARRAERALIRGLSPRSGQ